MSPPSWLHWPDVGGGTDLVISGVSDAANGTDNDPSSSPAVAGLVSFRIVAGVRIIITFVDAAAATSFVAVYPSGSSVVLTHDGTDYSASSITWDTASVSGTARIEATDFSSFPPTTANGQSYSFNLTI